jgi:hypothetical protein
MRPAERERGPRTERLWSTLELVTGVVAVGAVLAWAIHRARGGATPAWTSDYRVVIAAALVAAAVVAEWYSRRRARGGPTRED